MPKNLGVDTFPDPVGPSSISNVLTNITTSNVTFRLDFHSKTDLRPHFLAPKMLGKMLLYPLVQEGISYHAIKRPLL